MCTGNTIKPMTGDVATCSTSCGDTMKVSNAEHTSCGMLTISIMYLNLHTTPCQLCFRQSDYSKWLTKLTSFPKKSHCCKVNETSL